MTTQRARIAMTGAGSFLGGRLLEALCLNPDSPYDVFILDRVKPPSGLYGARFHQIDLTDPTADATVAELLRDLDITAVVHLAFLNHPILDQSYAHELEAIGSMHVMNACAQAGVQKLIISSTTAVYGALASNPNFLDEARPLRGNTRYRYIRDRIEVERMADRFRGRHPDITCTVLRFATPLGPTVNNFATHYFRLPIVPTIIGHDPLVQFVHEDDAVRALLLALDCDVNGAYNIVGEGVLPLSTVLKLMGKLTLPVFHSVFAPTLSALWLTDRALVPGYHLPYVKYLWVADGARAERELAFVPEYSVRDTVLSFAGIERPRAAALVA